MKYESNLEGAGAYDDIKKGEKFKVAAIAAAFFGAAIGYVAAPAAYLMLEGYPFSFTITYLSRLFSLDVIGAVNEYHWAWLRRILGRGDYHELIYFVFPLFFGVLLYAILTSVVKYSKTPNIFGDAHYAGEADIENMDRANIISNKRGELMVLGFFKKKMLRLTNHLSVLMLAPPGTGKTVGFIVPSLVNMDRVSVMVHDMKPELFTLTSGWRNRLGPAYEFKWSAVDHPQGRPVEEHELPFTSPAIIARDDDGEILRDERGRALTIPLFYPSWNPLSPRSMPRNPTARDMYIDRLVNVVCPDSPTGDKFWTATARAAIAGLIYFIIAKIECGNYSRIPEAWKGADEPSFPMLVDWFAEIQMATSEGGDDPLREVFREAIAEAKMENERAAREGRPEPFVPRCLNELAKLMNSPDRTRGSILVTMEQALSIFRQEAVRQRTMKSDLDFADLRGVPSQEAQLREQTRARQESGYMERYQPEDYEPVSVYICVSLEDAKVLSVISGLFIELANSYLIANGPGSVDDRGRKLGPLPFTFLLDEAPQMPRLEQTVVNGPAVGRSKEVNYVIVGQDFAQIQSKYSKDDVETLISTTAVKCVLSLNNDATAQRISRMVGKMTYKSESYSGGKGGGGGPDKVRGAFTDIKLDDFLPKSEKKNVSESWQSVELLKPSDLMSLPNDKHILIVQNFTNRPIKADTALFFKYPEIAQKVFNTRTRVGPLPAPPMPLPQMRAAALAKQGDSDLREAIRSKHALLIVTPSDMAAMSRNAWGETKSMPRAYAACEVTLNDEGPDYCARGDGRLVVTEDLAEISALARRKKIIVFDQTVFRSQIQQPLEALGLPTIPASIVTFLRERAKNIGEEDYGNLYELATEGAASLVVADNPALITPAYVVDCMEKVTAFIMGIEEQVRIVNDYYDVQAETKE